MADTEVSNEFGPDDDLPKTARKKIGRPRNENFLGWEEAREFIRGELIPSRGKFQEWWDRNKPKTIPRYPYRVYNDWTTWNDFLGNNNAFNDKIGTKWIPMEDAIPTIHALRIKTYGDWMTFVKQPGNLPPNIPARPDLVYDGWRSWNYWLGNRVVDVVQAKQEAAKSQVYYIIHHLDVPTNVLTFGVEPAGVSALKERWTHEQFDVIRMFWYDPEKSGLLKQIVDATTTPYLGNDHQRIAPTAWETIYHLSLHLDQVKL